MIQTPSHINPEVNSFADLANWQSIIDSEPTYETQIKKAKDSWGKSNQTMDDVKEKLRLLSNNTYRCNYCEDSYSDEVEHIFPKDIYPELTFVWDNYVYACGPCNGPKSNNFNLVDPNTITLQDVTPPRRKPPGYVYVRPPAYKAALIDPRKENPLQFIMLDIVDTFYFLSSTDNSNEEELRANYTIDVLRLNEREPLVLGRKQAFGNFRARLVEYDQSKRNGVAQIELNSMISNIKESNHITVWEEMKRWHQMVPALNTLFTNNPEALNW